jgi:hypothetical protein
MKEKKKFEKESINFFLARSKSKARAFKASKQIFMSDSEESYPSYYIFEPP